MLRLSDQTTIQLVDNSVSSLQLSVTHTVPLTNIDQDEIRAVCSEYRLTSATISIHEPDCTIDQVLDVLEGNRVYIPAVFVLNKIDAISIEGEF